MAIVDEKNLVFPHKSCKFLLYSKGFKVGEVEFPTKGATFFPPEYDFERGRVVYKIRADFADGQVLAQVRRAVDFWRADPNSHSLRLVVPGEDPLGTQVVPCGRWLAWFFDDAPVGYGPVEMTFCAEEFPHSAPRHYSDSEPWVVE